MQTDQLDYHLPPGRIAQVPAEPRDASRLMRLGRRTGALSHHRFTELPDLLAPGDALVINRTRVLPARFSAYRPGGGRIDGLFLASPSIGTWTVLLRGRGRLAEGQVLRLRDAAATSLRLQAHAGRGHWTISVDPPAPAAEILSQVGRPPLPPYIRRRHDDPAELVGLDRRRYQTVYAADDGSVAAPTAGLHFTDAVLDRCRAAGITILPLTLHVGLGTFQPIATDRLEDHHMHSEHYDLPTATADALNRTRAAGGRIVAVGTTVVRCLESRLEQGRFNPGVGQTELFIYGDYVIRSIDALVTNFHLPRSTLLAMVGAFAGLPRVLAAYRTAIEAGYRFYSYGDAMLIV